MRARQGQSKPVISAIARAGLEYRNATRREKKLEARGNADLSRSSNKYGGAIRSGGGAICRASLLYRRYREPVMHREEPPLRQVRFPAGASPSKIRKVNFPERTRARRRPHKAGRARQRGKLRKIHRERGPRVRESARTALRNLTHIPRLGPPPAVLFLSLSPVSNRALFPRL